jgi:hypothetical protein
VTSAFADHWNTSLHAPPQKRPGPPLNGTRNGRKSAGGMRYTGQVAAAELSGPLLLSSASCDAWPGGALTCTERYVQSARTLFQTAHTLCRLQLLINLQWCATSPCRPASDTLFCLGARQTAASCQLHVVSRQALQSLYDMNRKQAFDFTVTKQVRGLPAIYIRLPKCNHSLRTAATDSPIAQGPY